MRSAWRRFWSWWVYPATTVATFGFLALSAVGFASGWFQLLSRLGLLSLVMAAAYDQKVRQVNRERPESRKRHQELRAKYISWAKPYLLVLLAAIAVILSLIALGRL